jgi:type IV pilus assembly protein PilV
MVEVLISIVILSIGLLGTAGLISASLRNTNDAYYRSQATVLADDILDRMRANVTAARGGQYQIALDGSITADAVGVAAIDTAEWLANVQGTLPDGAARVNVAGGGVATVEIQWNGGADAFTTTSQL